MSAPQLTALERLLLEEIPTGQVRDWDPRERPAVTKAEAAQHRADLEAAIRRTTNTRRAA